MADICYLCGQPLPVEPSQDHVPPKQFFAPPLRAKVNTSKLITLATHRPCNEGYGADEEYFTWSLAPLAAGTVAADALNAYNASKFRSGRNVKLGLKVLREFQHRPSGLYLPPGKVVKKLEGKRIKRVAWKIVRGLHFHDTQGLLPECPHFALEIFGPDDEETSDLSELWEVVKAQQQRGVYPGVFDYKYLFATAEGEPGGLHAWGMLLWDKIMMFVGYDPSQSGKAAA